MPTLKMNGKKKTKPKQSKPIERISDQLRPFAIPIASLRPDTANSRAHPERNINAIAGSLARFGQQKPVVADRDGVVVAGHGQIEAAKRLGWTEIAVVRTTLSRKEAAAYAIADNRTGELSEWITEQLAETLAGIKSIGIDGIGFAPAEIDALLGSFGSSMDPPPAEFPKVDNDIVTEHRCPKCGYEWSGKKK